jgi:hypothetical protein
VCRKMYGTKNGTPESLQAFACCSLRLDWLICPLLVGAGKIHSPGAIERRISSMAATRSVIGIMRVAFSVFPNGTAKFPSRTDRPREGKKLRCPLRDESRSQNDPM